MKRWQWHSGCADRRPEPGHPALARRDSACPSECGFCRGHVVSGVARAAERVVVEHQRAALDRALDPDRVVVGRAVDDRVDLAERALVVLVGAQRVDALAEVLEVVGLAIVVRSFFSRFIAFQSRPSNAFQSNVTLNALPQSLMSPAALVAASSTASRCFFSSTPASATRVDPRIDDHQCGCSHISPWVMGTSS